MIKLFDAYCRRHVSRYVYVSWQSSLNYELQSIVRTFSELSRKYTHSGLRSGRKIPGPDCI